MSMMSLQCTNLIGDASIPAWHNLIVDACPDPSSRAKGLVPRLEDNQSM